MIRNSTAAITPDKREEILGLTGPSAERGRRSAADTKRIGSPLDLVTGNVANIDDAVIIEFSPRQAMPEIQPLHQVYQRLGLQKKIRATKAPVAPQPIPGAAKARPNLFNSSQSIQATISDNTITTSSGEQGKLFPLPEKSHLGFELGGFRGFFTSQGKGIAFNRQSGEMYQFTTQLSDGALTLSNIRPLSQRAFTEPVDRKPTWEAEMRNGSGEAQGMRVFMNPDGTLIASIRHGAADDSASKEVRGHGYFDKRGNLAIAFENQVTIKARYVQNNSRLKIYDYEYL